MVKLIATQLWSLQKNGNVIALNKTKTLKLGVYAQSTTKVISGWNKVWNQSYRNWGNINLNFTFPTHLWPSDYYYLLIASSTAQGHLRAFDLQMRSRLLKLVWMDWAQFWRSNNHAKFGRSCSNGIRGRKKTPPKCLSKQKMSIISLVMNTLQSCQIKTIWVHDFIHELNNYVNFELSQISLRNYWEMLLSLSVSILQWWCETAIKSTSLKLLLLVQ